MTTDTRAPLKNLARERMQAELRHLRVLAYELEKERDDLVERVARLDTTSRRGARHECKKRRQAEALNRLLRQRLNEHSEIIRHLRQLITEDDRDASPFRYLTRDLDLFRRFLDDLHVGYRMTDSIVNTVHWEEAMARDAWRIDARTSDHNGRSQMVMELQKQFTSPRSHFAPGVGDSRAWAFVSRAFQLLGYRIEELIVQEHTVAVRYRNAYTYRGQDFPVYASSMIKQFMEANRQVHVWRTKITREDEHEASQATVVDVAGWAMIQPAERVGE
ncbi:hypothetical protein Poli38472_011752 [Pythium oligandrum]|uniref:Uncharacterized protein n=1 Tax=Pythium oligandrum TaxID=41045 RepID=A0A8K1C7N9_PYTOL|nr:hypothetical protein Poli38472_011752 [Pythium oligandrum]|eukprot:TMW58164.1 hypothetical protein Poli38472_011752 [Pythium oligandrum]